ncbi:MAG: hypothetical protein KAS62_04265, partial [Candidatus Delongbacteria bacterium]|nr:hypothetical protein [Candidatus Delongbacteria bacterium]
ASNNIWSGGINGVDFLTDDIWVLDLSLFIDGDIQIGHYSIDEVYVVNNSLPSIDSLSGIASGILESGFQTKMLIVAVSDSNNYIAPYDEQILKMQLFNNSDIFVKETEYQRASVSNDFSFEIDSTYAAGVEDSRGYKIRFVATDLYGESDSLEIENIGIENTSPTIKNVEYPDSINTTESGVFWIYADIDDPQGHLSYQDIDKVEIEINLDSYELLDDGVFIASGDEVENDGVYTIGFSYDVGDLGSFDIQMLAYDKVGNISSPVNGNITLYSGKKNNIGNNNAEKFNYSNPFNTK